RDRKAVDRGIADPQLRFRPVLGHAVTTGLKIKELVERSGDDDIEVEKQHVSLQIEQGSLPHRDLAPAQPLHARGNIDRRQRSGFDTRLDALRSVGKADSARRPQGVAADHGSQFVDIVDAVARAPLHADDALLLHAFRAWRSLRARALEPWPQ